MVKLLLPAMLPIAKFGRVWMLVTMPDYFKNHPFIMQAPPKHPKD